MIALLLLAAFLALVIWRIPSESPPERRPFVDTGDRRTVFENAELGIRAIPDRIRWLGDEPVPGEHKSRPSRRSANGSPLVYSSEESQCIATALAMRGAGLPVVRFVISFGDGAEATLPLRASNRALEQQISTPLAAARQVAVGGEPRPLPSPAKCSPCGVRSRCPYAMRR